MFAEVRRKPPNRGRRTAVLHRMATNHHLTLSWMIHFLEEPNGLQVRILEQIFDRVDRARRDVDPMQGFEPFAIASSGQLIGQKSADVLGVTGSGFPASGNVRRGPSDRRRRPIA
jgi:hypothetical protein